MIVYILEAAVVIWLLIIVLIIPYSLYCAPREHHNLNKTVEDSAICAHE